MGYAGFFVDGITAFVDFDSRLMDTKDEILGAVFTEFEVEFSVCLHFGLCTFSEIVLQLCMQAITAVFVELLAQTSELCFIAVYSIKHSAEIFS